MRIRRVLLILKRSELEQVKSGRSRKDARLKRLMAEHHGSVERIAPAHAEHMASVRLVREQLRARGIEVVERTTAPRRAVKGFDLIITVGGDGTLLEASHAVSGRTLLLGVNSAPAFSVGFLTGCRAPTLAPTLELLEKRRLEPIPIRRLVVHIGRRLLPVPVLNDVLYCADHPAVTTRYRLITPDGEELHRSSGIWVATAAGSTAALRSAGGPTLSLTAKQFAFVVREPYAPPGSGVLLTNGVLDEREVLTVESRTAAASVFLDGAHRRYPVRHGEQVHFSLGAHPLWLVRSRSPIERG